MVVIDVEVIRCGILPGVTVVEPHVLPDLVHIVVLRTGEVIDHRITALGGSRQAVTELALDPQVLDGLEFRIDAGMQGIELLQVVTAPGEIIRADRVLGAAEERPAFGILHRLIIEAGDIAFFVRCIDGQERNGADGIVQGTVVDVAFSDTAVLAEAEIQRLADLEQIQAVAFDGDVVAVDAEGITAVFGIDRIDLVVAEDTVLAGIGQTHGVPVVRVAAGQV